MLPDWLRKGYLELTGEGREIRASLRADDSRRRVLDQVERSQRENQAALAELERSFPDQAQRIFAIREPVLDAADQRQRGQVTHAANTSAGLLTTAAGLTTGLESARTRNQQDLATTQATLQRALLGDQRRHEGGMADRFIGTGAFLPQVLDHSADMARLHYGTIRDMEALAKPQGFTGVLERLAPIAMAGAMLFS